VREDRHAELRVSERPHRVESLRKRTYHHRGGSEFHRAHGTAHQRVDPAADVDGVLHVLGQRRDNGTHAFLERAPRQVAEQLVVLDKIDTTGGEGSRSLRHLGRRETQ
jgi:hypothetical protein